MINYDIPDHPDMFTHRTGRTGRMGRAGRSVTLVSGADLGQLASIEHSLERRIPRRYWEDLKGDLAPVLETPAAPEAASAANGSRAMPGERLSGRPTTSNGSYGRSGSNGHNGSDGRRGPDGRNGSDGRRRPDGHDGSDSRGPRSNRRRRRPRAASAAGAR